MLTEMFDALDCGGDVSSSVADSVASHLSALAAEKSRVSGGELITIADFERENCKQK